MLKLAKTSLLAVAVMATSVVASDILVTVNGKNVTKQDAEQFIKASSSKATFSQLAQEQKDMIKERLVEKILFTELAEKEGMENKPEFKKAMKSIKDELLVNVWMKTQLDSTLVSDSEAKEFYEKNKNKFVQPESAKAYHILVKTEEEAKKIIEELKPLDGAKLKEQFEILAKSKSTGPSGPKGGSLGIFTKDKMVPEFSKATWALEDGTITLVPVKTQFGYHIIYLEKKNLESTVPYEDVKERIIISLKQKQFTVKVGEIAKELKSKATIVNADKK